MIKNVVPKKSHNVKGFLFSAVKAGIKKKDALDLGLILSKTKASAAAVFTKNAVKAAPVHISIDKIKSGYCKGVIVNSGNANAATGDAGLDDARDMALFAAHYLNVDEDDILVSSTGVIGKKLEIKKIKKKIPELCNSLRPDGAEDFAKAIMTTDTFLKVSQRTFKASDKDVTVFGAAKGSGMIMPNLATMLSFVVTDASIEPKYLRTILKRCVDITFNRLTVDGDTSTNDMVLLMANGESGADEIVEGSPQSEAFFAAVKDVMYDLSVMIAKDGEGATKLIKIITLGAQTEDDAQRVSRKIANSPLVKTAFFGEDANVGRLLMAIGNADAKIYPNEIDIYLDDVQIVKKSMVSLEANEEMLSKIIKGDDISVTVDLNIGQAKAQILTCDLSYDYIKINAEYTT
jgi:glutamate N-acetyltransferase/amino-acid N-acetyltransferase